MHHYVNWTLGKLPLIEKGREAEKNEAALNTEVANLKAALAASEATVKGLQQDMGKMKTDHDAALKAQTDSLQSKVDVAVKAALEDASESFLREYKVSDEFISFGFEYMERGVKAACVWAAMKEKESGTLAAADFVGLGFADPMLARALEEVEEGGAAPSEVAPPDDTVTGDVTAHDEGVEVATSGQADEDVGLGSEAVPT